MGMVSFMRAFLLFANSSGRLHSRDVFDRCNPKRQRGRTSQPALKRKPSEAFALADASGYIG